MPQAKTTSKPFRVAFAGQTVDGRVIEAQWLKDAAETYNPELYTAEIFPEHWRGLTPGGDFSTQGSVVSLYTQEDTVAGEKATALYAVIAPNTNLIEMNRRGEKKYASIEIDPDFRGSGKAYLTGMAVTDSPASVATEALQFSAKYNNKQITDKIEAKLEFTDETEKEPSMFTKAIQSFKDKLNAFGNKSDKQLTELVQGMGEMIDKFADEQKRSDEANIKLSKQVDELQKQLDKLEKQFAVIDTTDANPVHRPAATGSNGYVAASC